MKWMISMNEVARKLGHAAPAEPHYREAPNNIEAEQALLGAILVNNDAYYRVSDFLKPVHFHEPLHRYHPHGQDRPSRDDQDVPAGRYQGR
jgi:hypothetical protein